MLETYLAGQVPDWQFVDSLNGLQFGLDSGTIEAELQQRQLENLDYFGSPPSQIYSPEHFIDHDVNDGMGGKLPADFYFHPSQPMGKSAGPQAFNSLPHDQIPGRTHSLDDLLRSTSQLATERALFMNAPMSSPPSTFDGTFSQTPFSPDLTAFNNNPSLILDPCSSPETSQSYTGSEEEQDMNFNFYQLPSNDFAPIQQHTGLPENHQRTVPSTRNSRNNANDSLTPLEMPDGSTRLTSNWLPVDPEGGFTIGGPWDENALDMEPLAYGKHAFISAEMSVSNFAV